MTARFVSMTRLTGGVLLLSLLTAHPAFAEDDEFKQGVQARSKGEWARMAMLMKAAIARAGDQDRKVKVGGFGPLGGQEVPYVPFFFLGEALSRQGDCLGALEAWTASRQRGVVTTRSDFRKIVDDGQAECGRRGFLLPDEYASNLASARQGLTEATQHAQRVSSLGQANTPLWRSHPEWAERYDRVTSELANAGKRLETATASHQRGEFTETKAATDRAVVMLNDLETAVRAAIDAARSFAGVVREVEDLINKAESIDKTLDSVGAKLPAPLVRSRESARKSIDEARERLNAARSTQNSAAATDARRAASDALSVLTPALDEARTLVREAEKKQFDGEVQGGTELFASLDATIARLETLAGERHDPAAQASVPEREKARKEIASARRRFDQARDGGNLAGMQQAVRSVSGVQARLEALLSTFGPLTLRDRGVSEALENGARLFLQGEYQQAIAALDAASLDSVGPLTIHAHLLRAASFYTLYVRSGEKDQSLLTRAVAEVAECRLRDPGFEPDARVFGKRFIAFFQNRGRAGQDQKAEAQRAP